MSTRVAPILPAPLPPLNAPNPHPSFPSLDPRLHPSLYLSALWRPHLAERAPRPQRLAPRTGSQRPSPSPTAYPFPTISAIRFRHALPLLRFSLPHPARATPSRPFSPRLPDRWCTHAVSALLPSSQSSPGQSRILAPVNANAKRHPAPPPRWRARRLHALSLTATIQALKSKSPALLRIRMPVPALKLPVLAIQVSNLRVSQMHALANKCRFKSQAFEPSQIDDARLESKARISRSQVRGSNLIPALANPSQPFPNRRAHKLKSRPTCIASDEHEWARK
ncbi:hypothetical protein DFH09DRAFT_1319751 [Mycena vulgaris]|nr:hypothetical protein DFH09DRAFT_1319751 [Mycena vulgaris]